jgi:hypothetical protein
MLGHFKKLILGLAAGVLAMSAGSAHADLIVSLPAGSPTQSQGYSAGYSMYSYELSTDSTTYLTAGDGFTISGIAGLFNALAPTNFTVTDDLSLGTVTYTYTGPTTGTSQAITGFIINTSPGYENYGPGSYTADGTSALGTVDSSGSVTVPALGSTPAPSSPEPGTFAMASLAIPALGCWAWKKRKAAAV